VSRAVCRNCWTWYSKGETACPNCQIPLTAANAGAQVSGVDAPAPLSAPETLTPPPGLVQSTAVTSLPAPARLTRQRINWLQSVIAGILLIGLIVAGVLLVGDRGAVTSSDGVLSVKVPQGWARGQAPPADAGKPVLALARIKKMNGVEPHFIVTDTGHFFQLSDWGAGWEQYVESGEFPVAGTVGLAARTTVAGAPALAADFQGSKFAGQILFVNYGSKTYVIWMSSDAGEFAQLRDSDFAAILSSWEWH
jgi:hypothetical protein